MKTFRPEPCLRSAYLPRTGPLTLALGLAVGLTLGGCASINSRTAEGQSASTVGSETELAKAVVPPFRGGGYYKDDGPGANPPANLDAIPDAVPQSEPFHQATGRPYQIMGKRYVPLRDNKDYKAQGLASWYGRKFHGNSTAIGEPYDMYAMSAAHPTLPLPSYARVTNLENGKSVVVRVNDRGPFHAGRIIDLSYTAAHKLDILRGVTPVEVAAVLPEIAPTSFAALSENIALPTSRPDSPALRPSSEQPATARSEAAIYLQLGAFSSPASADGLMARVSARLSRTFPGVMRIEHNGLLKVQAGPFDSDARATLAAAEIERDLGIKAFKVRVEQAAAAPIDIPAAPGLYLQLAAFSSPDAAAALSNRVKQHYGNELPGLDQINSGSLFKVRAGPFASPAAAERLASAYLQDFGVKPYRVSR
jgi:rare lipoprotein A